MKFPPLNTIATFLVGGFAAQAASAIAGLLLVRYMTVGEYAIYTVGVTMIGAIALLTRGGVQIALAAMLAKFWPDQQRAAEAVSAAYRVRLLVSALTLPPIMLVAWLLLGRADAGIEIRVGILAILGLYWIADTRGAVVDQVLFFGGRAVKVQFLDTALAMLRVVLIVGLRLILPITALLAMITNLFPVAARVPFIRVWVMEALGHNRAVAPLETTKEMRKVATQQLPIDLFTVVQAQVALYFLTRNGGGLELATFGALSRIAQILAPIAALNLAFFVPSFATVRGHVLLVLLKFAAIAMLSGIALSLWAWLAPDTLLFLLGPTYADQSAALLIFAIALTFINTVQVIWNLVSHRGWNRWGWLRIALGIVWIGVAPTHIAVETASGIFLFNCGFSAITLAILGLELLSAQRAGEIKILRSMKAG